MPRQAAVYVFILFLWGLSSVLQFSYSHWVCHIRGSTSTGVASSTQAAYHSIAQAEQKQQQSQQYSKPHSTVTAISAKKFDCVPSADDVHMIFAKQWGDACTILHNACMDEGTFVTFGDSPYKPIIGRNFLGNASSTSTTTAGPGASISHHVAASSSTTNSATGTSSSELPWQQLRLGNNHLDFRGFGDVAGIIQYPPPIIRPGSSDEEAPDLRPPGPHFSHCVRPVVLYLNFLYMFGDFWMRTMPAFMHAMAAGAWDSHLSIVIATGGQKLDRWQKLVLQTLSEHPVVTLSAASSRAFAASSASHYQRQPPPQEQKQDQAKEEKPGQSQLQGKGPPGNHLAEGQQRQHQHQRQLRQQQQQQQQQQPLGAHAASAGLTHELAAHGRCFEWVVACSLDGPRTFPVVQSPSLRSHPQAVDTGATTGSNAGGEQGQSSKAGSNANSSDDGSANSSSSSSSSSSITSGGTTQVPRETWAGAQYVKKYYLRRYGSRYYHLLPGYESLRDKGAFRVVFAVRGLPAAAAAGSKAGVAGSSAVSEPSSSSSSTTGRTWDFSEEELAASTRQLLNLQELLAWCNAWKPVATAAGTLGGVTAGDTAGGTRRYSHAVCIAHIFGQHGRVGDAPRSVQRQQRHGGGGGSTASGSWRGWLMSGGRRRLTAAAAANAAAAGDAAQWQQQSYKGLQSGRRLHSTSSSSSSSSNHGSISGSDDGSNANVPGWQGDDPDLDPRALLVDLCVLDHADVVVGVHGAQLYNALFMPAHKALVEVRPYEFWGGWPASYFRDPLVKIDGDDGILWFGIDTVNSSNSRPGRWEQQGLGVPGTYARDRHTRLEPAALELVLSRVIWASEDPAAYKNLKYSLLTHITDTLQPADAYHAALKKAQAAAAQQWLQQHKARPEVAAALKAAKEGLVGAPARAAVTDTAVAVPTAGSTVGQTAGQ